MNPLREILTGLAIALLGMGATTGYILALSHLFVGRWSMAAIEAFFTAGGFLLFYRCIGEYLSAVLSRFPETCEDEKSDEK